MVPDQADHVELVTAESNVDELISRYPSTVPVFVRHRMVCVGCEVARFETLAEACEIYHKPLEPLLADLQEAVANSRQV
jgi:hybrid cluster-associated redox disulfide protein